MNKKAQSTTVTRRRALTVGATALAGLGLTGVSALAQEDHRPLDQKAPPALGTGKPSVSDQANEAFWNLLSNDYRSNCLAWRHYPANPILPPRGESWKRVWTANPDLLTFQDRLLLYYRGHGRWGDRQGDHDRIGVAEVETLQAGELALRDLGGGDPVVDVGPAGTFDGEAALDPATTVFEGDVYLFYSAIGAGPDSVGLAVSADGVQFEKVGNVMDGRAPDCLTYQDKLYLLYQENRGGHYELFLSVSEDGEHFESVQQEPLLSRDPGQWDAHSHVTARLSRAGDWFYLLYGGSAYLLDEPEYFGLARSRNLVDWERHPGNPIFGCGPQGAPDGGAIWFPALWETDTDWVLLYEGSPGKYSWNLDSAICMAWLPKASTEPVPVED